LRNRLARLQAEQVRPDPGGVDGNGQGTELRIGPGHDVLDRILVGDIELLEADPPMSVGKLLCGLIERRPLEVDHDDAPTLIEKRARDGKTDTGGAAGH
jgi:hypothetical protein